MSGNVLIVDDDLLLVRSITRLLGNSFNVQSCLSGKGALAWLESGNEPDVIVSDLDMPEMNGITFLKNARKILPDTSLYLLSGNQDSKMLRLVESHLADVVGQLVSKPCNPSDLISLLEDGIEKSRAKRSELVEA